MTPTGTKYIKMLLSSSMVGRAKTAAPIHLQPRMNGTSEALRAQVMIQTIKTRDLKVGMHIILPASWLNHPFLRSRFVINSREQIKNILASGFEEVSIDTDKGAPATDNESMTHGDRDLKPPQKWEPEKLVSDALREAVRDQTLAPEKKALAVYHASVELMGKLLADPKAENLREAKKGIAAVVDLIISDRTTAEHMLRITSHDFYTYTHSVNVGVLSIMLAKELFRNSDGHDMHELGAGFFLHDLGKIRVAPAIINKPGRLTVEEMQKMRIHPYQSYKIIEEAGQLSEECRIIAMQHHEREDGTGYPRRLKGDDIHAYGRICCIADVYDALTAERSYKPQLAPFEALKLMKEEMLHHFHREIFEKFVLLFI